MTTVKIDRTELRERCFDAQLRVETIWQFDTMCADIDAAPDELIEWLSEPGLWRAVAVAHSLPATAVDTPPDIDDPCIAEEVLANLTGWAIEVQSPDLDRYPMFSWGICDVAYFAGPTYDSCVDAALEWAEGRVAAAHDRMTNTQGETA